jgi:shikimate dehydrogenase
VSRPADGYRFVVLGDPVSHSMSPTMHTAALEALGIPGTYVARRVDVEGMQEAATEMRRGDLDGANITMPHKRVAAELADVLAPEAARAWSVNTWVRIDGDIVGHSTDVHGVRTVIDRCALPDGPVTVLGTGGAAAASLIALEGRPITVVARRPEAAADMAAKCGVDIDVLAWDERPSPGLVINCTPIGMHGEALPAHLTGAATGFFEMVYASGATPAEVAARTSGIPVAGGLDLLAAQAEASFQLWTGTTPPPGVMYGSVDKHLKTHFGGAEA